MPRFKEVRHERGFSQEALAKASHISRRTIAKCDHGYRPTHPLRAALARALRVTDTELFDNAD
jgi:DNA-binding XRE family transcriptional regulator